MQDMMERLGYVSLEQPKTMCPVLTAEMLTTTDANAYTTMFAEFKAWRDFYRERLAEVSNLVLQYKNMLIILEVQTKKVLREMADARQERLSIDRLKEKVLENPEYQDAMLELQRYTQGKELLESKFESLDKSLSMISRQIEIRRIDIEQHRVANNLGYRGVPPQGFR